MNSLVQEINGLLLTKNATGVTAQEIWEVVADHEDRARQLLAAIGTDRASVDLMIQRELCVNLAKRCAELRAALERRNKDASVLRKLHEEHLAPAINMELIQAEDAADVLLQD